MAKIRIYELARELNMKNKALLDKLAELDISVRSHMSSLEDETVAQIKRALFGKKSAAVEVTRVRPTVIRRRKRDLAKPPEEAPEAPSEEIPAAEAEAPLEAESAQPAAEEVETAAPPPVSPAPEAPPVETPVEEAPVAETPPEEAPARPPAEETSAPPVEIAAEAPGSAEAEDRAAAEKPAPAKVEKPVKVKRKKGEAVAKIISLPTREVVRALQAEKEERREAEAPAAKVERRIETPAAVSPEETAAREGRKKKGKKREEEPVAEKKLARKKEAFRRKEVVEGADLYASGGRGRKGRKAGKAKVAKGQKTQITTPKAIKRRIKVDDAIVLSELAKRMGIKANEIIGKLMGLGVMVTVNQTVDYETAVLVASEFNFEVEKAAFEEEAILKVATDEPDQLLPRPPVVTIMGHVDHGKTSLLDVIRETRVTEGEAGGITQHIGAYNVSTPRGQIVFLDTPGHEAFTAMRARGAQVTDIVILVVAADDGVMPQTIEAINHAKASEVPIIVAVNKMDKANADPDRVQRQLAEVGLMPEEWGGDTIFVKVSAKQNQGIEDLLEMILLQSEFLELKANPNKLASGHVVESKLDSGRGPVATILIQDGTLRTGDPIVCGIYSGKVRAMLNDRGQPVEVAGPSIPVEILGLTGVPGAGDEFVALADEKNARQVSQHRAQKQRAKELAKTSRVSLESLFERMKEGEVKDLNLIIKADVDGSIEALRDSLVKLSNEEVKINVIHAATGTITESDVSLAAVSDAIIIGFNVRPNTKVADMAQEEHVDIRYHNIIYNVIKEVKDAIVGLMESTYEERVLGLAEVREVFHVPKVGTIAGAYVTEGKIERGQRVRLLRDGIIQFEGKIASLRRFKDDVKEVQHGYECGIGIENYNDIKIGDEIQCFFLEEIKPALA
ncbi:MAG: translation initiation factor IF-2 [Desulfobacteraceae bacterium]|jgi:translation initiation factor IF-2